MATQVGRYRVLNKLATGGMAEVFLAKAAGPKGFEKSLVIKRILPHLAEDSRFVEMFLAEARLAAQLNHPNIVQIFDFGEFEDTYYLAMEYIDGPNLRTLVRRAREAGVPLPPVCCAKIISLACEGLAFAHAFASPETGEPLNLIHRDISPDNILLSQQGSVKVVDFGIAKAANQEHKTQTGLIKGKVAYMPPEQIQGLPLDRRVDVYSLGVVLYELLTGAKPFDATSDVSLMRAIVSDPIVPATVRQPGVPRVLSQMLERTLAKEREDRYPDCRALQADLERFILSAREPMGAWQISQLVLSVLGEAPTPGPASSTGKGSRNAASSLSWQGIRPSSAVQTAVPLDFSESSLTAREFAAPVEEEAVPGTTQESTASPKRRTYWKAALLLLALLIMGGGAGGAVFAVTHASSDTVALQAPPPPAPAQPRVAPQAQPEVAALQQATTQEPLPILPPQLPERGGKPSAGPRVKKPVPLPVVVLIKSVTQPMDTPDEVPPAPVIEQPVSEKVSLEFRIRPYAVVVLDGKQIGQSPLPPTEVEVGTHTVLLINHDLHKEVTHTIEVKAGRVNVFKYNLLED